MILYAIISLIWLMSLVLAYVLGFYIRTIVNRLKKAEKTLRALIDKKTKKPEPESPSSFVDMEDPAQVVKWEHEQALKRLNPEQ